MKATPSPCAAASRMSWPESNMVDRRRGEARHAGRLAPFVERLGQVAVEQDGGLGEAGADRSVAARRAAADRDDAVADQPAQ